MCMSQREQRQHVIITGDEYDTSENDSIDSMVNDDYEDIFDEDQDHLDIDKADGNYYIGMQAYVPYRHIMLITNSISAPTFFKYSGNRICGYLYRYSVIRVSNPSIDIIKLSILPDDSYSVITKTHWLRLVQRTWKRVYQERQKVLINRAKISSQRHFELHGQYPYGLNYMPSLRGMLCPSFIETH
uniref:Uncharacterized protein n=1 Tax=viral metagenome TaxID=1070528 RepID=A0A6C0ARV3_9ZZZZ